MNNTNVVDVLAVTETAEIVEAVEAAVQAAPAPKKVVAKRAYVKRTATLQAPVKKARKNASAASKPVVEQAVVGALATVKETVVKKAAVKKTAVKKIAVEKIAVKNTAVKKTAVKKTAVKQAATPGTAVPMADLAPNKSLAQSAQNSSEKIKPKKPKLIRDSFTIPENEYQVLEDLKKRCLKAGVEIKKSDLIRIGIASLHALTVAQLGLSKDQLQKLKVGRPKK